MRLTYTLHLYLSLGLVTLLAAVSAREAPSDVAGKGLSPRPTAVPAAAPTSASRAPVSACATQCIEDSLKKSICGSLDEEVCFCTKLTAAASVQACVKQSCPPSDEATLVSLFTQKCIGIGSSLPLSSLFSASLGASQVPSTSAPVPAPSAAPGTHTTGSASSAATATEAPTSETEQRTTAAAAPNASQSDAAPVTTLGMSPDASDPRGSISTNVDGVQVTLTVTDSPGAEGTALNPSTNDARRTGRGVLSASLCVLVAVCLL
ncbi:hypothetical protein VTO73DRAFT_9008 [Trametes versicolor]